jgi:Activator of Hsp90 ATPase homolog 1-like protein
LLSHKDRVSPFEITVAILHLKHRMARRGSHLRRALKKSLLFRQHRPVADISVAQNGNITISLDYQEGVVCACCAELLQRTFEESQGRTRLTLHQLFPSKEALEGALASGMESGMRVTLDQLEALVASMR